MNERTESPLGRLARLAIVATGAWILTGALFKLLLGTPADLPEPVKDVGLPLGTTYRLAISIELVLATLAFFKPRWAWLPLLGALVVFDLVLTHEIERGESSCKCFGGNLSVPPMLMLAIDSALFLGLVLTRPWSTVRARGAPAVLVVTLAALGVALPWVYDRETSAEEDGGVVIDEEPVRGGYAVLDVESWVGKDLGDTELGRRMDSVYSMPPDALWVLYRWTCEHCAKHLRELADTELGQRYLVLCRLKESVDSDANRQLDRMPEGDFVFHCELPDTVEYVVTTPAELEVEAFVVKRAAEGVGSGEE